jgi:3-oxoacyl-[acyl-carrier protein] reductase
MILSGKRVLITGASRGIGQCMARLFVKEGAKVLACARSADVLTLDDGQNCFALRTDLSNETELKRLVQFAREKMGGLDVLVNNAGIMNLGKLGMVRMEDVRSMLETNVVAMINLTQYAIRLMPKGKGGSVINLASIAGTQGMEGISAYCASKAAVIGFTLSSAKELAAQGVRVNAIAPGFIDTAMARQLDQEWFAKRVESIRLGRIGQPSDIANCALFLASDLSSYITGQVIGVDGGMQA